MAAIKLLFPGDRGNNLIIHMILSNYKPWTLGDNIGVAIVAQQIEDGVSWGPDSRLGVLPLPGPTADHRLQRQGTVSRPELPNVH